MPQNGAKWSKKIMQIIPIMTPQISGITSWSEFWICVVAMILGALMLLAIILIVVGLIMAMCYIYGSITDWRFERQKNKKMKLF